MRLPLLALVYVSACGRVGFNDFPASDASGSVVDAGSRAVDAEPGDAAIRTASGPFGPPIRILELSDALLEDDDPSLTGDMLEIYFKRNSEAATDLDIYVARRADTASLWSTPIRSAELSSDAEDNTPEVSSDGLTIYFSSRRDGPVDVYRSTRPTRSASWSTPTRVPELSSGNSDYAVTMDGAGLNLVMTRIVSGAPDLFAATRASTLDPWTTPVAISELNSARYEADAVLDESGLRIFFTATTADGLNGRELFTASRPSTTEPFGAAIPVEGLNTTDDDEDPWISSDLTTIYFVRNTVGGQDLYVATRPLDP